MMETQSRPVHALRISILLSAEHTPVCLPRYGSQGEPQTLAEINAAVGTPAYSWGAYDHIEADDYVPG